MLTEEIAIWRICGSTEGEGKNITFHPSLGLTEANNIQEEIHTRNDTTGNVKIKIILNGVPCLFQ
jgi:hypothetical protein